MKKVLSAGVILLAGVSLLPAHAQVGTPPPQTGTEAVEAAKPKTPKKARAKSKSARRPAAKATNEGETSAAAQSEKLSPGVNPKDAASFYDIGMGHYESKRFKEAVEAFKQSIRLGSTDAKTYFTLGQSYYRLRQYIDAREAYKRAARVKPDWAEPHYQLGWVYHILKDNDASQAQYKILQTLSPEMAANFQKMLDDEEKAAIAAITNPALTKGAATGSAASNQETAKANVPEAAAPAKIQEPSSSIETAPQTTTTTTTAAPDGTNKQTTLGEIASNSTTNGAATNNAVGSNSASANPASASTNPASTPAKDETAAAEAVAATSSSELPPTSVYRPGAGDVLDIRLLNSPTARSTLFTVMNGGLIEYPLAGGSFSVNGLTTDEIGVRLTAELKRRGISVDSPVVVGVRDYASHTVIISGLVNYPGKKILHREAEPLYVVAAEAQLRAEASRAVIMRGGSEPISIDDLTNPAALNFLVKPGDVITINARQLQYYFIGGRINSPGQKPFQPSLTLIQAILAAGGLSRSQDTVEISREEADGRLTTTKYALKEIKAGKIPDPRLQPGDRIEVGH